MGEGKEMGGRITRRPWSDLPKELLEIIADFLLSKVDVSRFCAVCKSWQTSVPPFQDPFSFPLKVPYLTPYNHHAILTVSTIYLIAPPPPSNSQVSTSWGWLVKVKEGESGQFHVSNSLSCQPTHHFPTFPKAINLLDFRVSELAKAYSLHFPNNAQLPCKVVFSSHLLMMIAAGILFYLKIGDNNWIAIDHMVSQLDYEDVILYENKFCAVDKDGRAVVVINNSSLEVIEIASPLKGKRNCHKKILVESAGDLLLVERLPIEPYFKVFKLKVEAKEWVETKGLDDKVMFLGGDCCFCVAAKDFGNGCKGNCIFFTDPCFSIFNLENGSLLPLHIHSGYKNIFYPPSTWSTKVSQPSAQDGILELHQSNFRMLFGHIYSL